MSTKMREFGIDALKTVLKQEKNCSTFENYVFTQINDKKNEDEKEDEKFEQTYLWAIYQIVGLLYQDSSIMKTLLKDVKKGKICWNSSSFDPVRDKLEEHDNYIVNPFEVVSGISQCPKCGSDKTWSVQQQVRSSDEPMTTFSRCVKCDFKWKYAG